MSKKSEGGPVQTEPHSKRDFVGVTFSCCNVYSRIYLDSGKSLVYGWCPRCGARIEITISPDGSKSRFFTAD
ncbi:MAG: hypothetical protein IH914_08050 [candidate division Zixibacteria bacterium]|nr:hypothetical protein [candidate division Zixibacteria bacterium]